MTTAIIGNISPAFLSSRLLVNSRTRFLFGPKNYWPVIFKRGRFAAKVRAASSTAFVKTKPTDPAVVEEGVSGRNSILACPVCYAPLISITEGVLSLDSATGTKLQCSCCDKCYSGTETHLELTATSGASKYGDAMPIATEIFRNLILVRADIARLPFMSCSIDAVHAGAAIHCWPSPTSAVVEICRVLKPGGVFVGTTTYLMAYPDSYHFWDLCARYMTNLRCDQGKNFSQISGGRSFVDEGELEDICTACGLVGFTCDVE